MGTSKNSPFQPPPESDSKLLDSERGMLAWCSERLRVGLDPFAEIVVRDLKVVAFVEGGDNINANDPIVGIIVCVRLYTEIDVDGS
jgi:hypothetical protein